MHYTGNETIGGVEFHWIPDTGAVPLVCDLSSSLLSRPLDVSRFGLIYAGAQKNIGPAGLTIVIVREDLIGHAPASTPSMFDYKIQADNDSMYNTPPTYALYIAGLVFQWLKRRRRPRARWRRSTSPRPSSSTTCWTRAGSTPARWRSEDRSRMNVPFTLARCEPGRGVPAAGQAARTAPAQGPPLGGRHARLDLQRHAAGGRARAGGVHAGVRAHARVTGEWPSTCASSP